MSLKETYRRREGHVKPEAVSGVMQPQGQERLEPPEAGRSTEGPFLRAYREHGPAIFFILIGGPYN